MATTIQRRHVRSPRIIRQREIKALLGLEEMRDVAEETRVKYLQVIRERVEDGASFEPGRFVLNLDTGAILDSRTGDPAVNPKYLRELFGVEAPADIAS